MSALRTALVLVLDDAQPALEPVRAEFHAEAVARGIPLHVTVLFPFVAPDVVETMPDRWSERRRFAPHGAHDARP